MGLRPRVVCHAYQELESTNWPRIRGNIQVLGSPTGSRNTERVAISAVGQYYPSYDPILSTVSKYGTRQCDLICASMSNLQVNFLDPDDPHEELMEKLLPECLDDAESQEEKAEG